MSAFKSMHISSSGLSAQQVRMNLLSANLANAQATRGGPGGGPYQRQDVILEAAPVSENPFENLLDEAHQTPLSNVKVRQIHSDTKPPRLVYDPSHPDSNKDGYVAMPNVQVMSEMVNMIAATRAYEANTTALNNAKQMAVKALEIGR
jgi:flagellar basal-body rod protein FlgC